MSTVDPFRRFLGVSAHADEQVLLGMAAPLTGGATDRIRVRAALRRRLEQIDRHPAGGSDDAQRVRERLHEVADVIEARTGGAKPEPRAIDAPRPGSLADLIARRRAIDERSASASGGPRARAQPWRETSPLTALERKALAVLVGMGGWNRRSRGRLVRLAAAEGIDAEGLVRLVRDLSRHARDASTPARPEDLAAAARAAVEHESARRHVEPEGLAERAVAFTRAHATDLRGDSFVARVRLAAIFAVIAIVAATGIAIVLVRSIDRPGGGVAAEPPANDVDAYRPPEPGGAEDGGSAEPATVEPAVLQAPGFRRNARPEAVLRAAREFPEAVAELEALAPRIAIAGEAIDATRRRWGAAQATAAIAWPIVDGGQRRAFEDATDRVLLEASGDPATVRALLDGIDTLPPRLVDPLDAFRGAWAVGSLARIAGRPDLPRTVSDEAAERARRLLDEDPARISAEAGRATDFDAAASSWLARAGANLAGVTATGDGAYDRWSAFLSVRDALADPGARARPIAAAVFALLAAPSELGRSRAATNVLGTLLASASPTDTADLRDALLRAYDDTARVATADLWLATSVLAALRDGAWRRGAFDTTIIPSPSATEEVRRRFRDRLARAWPAIATEDRRRTEEAIARGGADVDPGLYGAWLSAVESASAPPASDDEAGRLWALLRLARLNLAASLIATGRDDDAVELLQDFGSGLEAPGAAGPGNVVPAPAVGGSIDGAWADDYRAARRRAESLMAWLERARTLGAGDVGPRDARVLADVVVDGPNPAARELARAIVLEHYRGGAEVLMAVVDAMAAERRLDADTAEFVGTLTGRMLPAPRTAEDRRILRLAMLDHVLEVAARADVQELERIAATLADVLRSRERILATRGARGSARGTSGGGDPATAAASLRDGWTVVAGERVAREPVPAAADELAVRAAARAGTAEGGTQRLVAELVSILEHAAYVAVAERPGFARSIASILETSGRVRREATHALDQAREAERALARIWALRLEPAERLLDVPGGGRDVESDDDAGASPAGGTRPNPNAGDPRRRPAAPRPAPGVGGGGP